MARSSFTLQRLRTTLTQLNGGLVRVVQDLPSFAGSPPNLDILKVCEAKSQDDNSLKLPLPKLFTTHTLSPIVYLLAAEAKQPVLVLVRFRLQTRSGLTANRRMISIKFNPKK